eukprot:TRINITY_DN70560_c0_g1_i1.p1 TRINITY_DN70560_c0_g1~~TRINITY_DN70560_c0_g1_i1.p1  ORF type:complete len:385 (-),score=53.71 TRINITY_DN70560_c0_g1_i1:461-1546(-)
MALNPAPEKDFALPAYGDAAYWDKRFAKQQGGPGHAAEEWYLQWEEVQELLCSRQGSLGDCALRPGCRILELGCGSGHFAIAMASAGFDVVAIDFAASAIEEAERLLEQAKENKAQDVHCSCRFLVGDVRSLVFEATEFDAVIDKGCFDAIRVSDCPAMLSEACRVLRPGGLFFALSNNNSLVRSHARKLTTWKALAGSPLPVVAGDDELWAHCYQRCGAHSGRQTGRLVKEAAMQSTRMKKPAGPVCWTVRLAVPWASCAEDVELLSETGGSSFVVVPTVRLSARGDPKQGEVGEAGNYEAVELRVPLDVDAAEVRSPVAVVADCGLRATLPAAYRVELESGRFSVRRRWLSLRLLRMSS